MTDGDQVAVADFNGDGKPDVAAFLSNSSTVVIMQNASSNGVGSFKEQASSIPITAGAYVNNMVAADINGAFPGNCSLNSEKGKPNQIPTHLAKSARTSIPAEVLIDDRSRGYKMGD